MLKDKRRGALGGLLVVLAAALLGCGGRSEVVAAPEGLSAQARLGELIFKDASLSASGVQSCATCHDKGAAHGAPNAFPAQLGGANMDIQGNRQSPTIRYLATNKAFTFDKEGTPTGGFFWDGRAASLAEQAAGPFLNPREMAMPGKASVVAKLAEAPYAADFKQVFGAGIFGDVERAYLCMTLAIQRYELEDAEFHPFDSKYDAFLAGKAVLSPQEKRGLALFNSPAKGNCAACHPSARGADGAPPMFTDFTYDVLGVPRNPELKDNADPASFDLGLAARAAGDLADRKDLYGAFKVPTLRNVALRKVFFHNGYFKTLKEAVTFYVQRDTNPEKFYPLNPDGSVNKFNDLPAAYHANVNVTEAPYNRKPGEAPALTDEEIDDLIAFLNTLTDGYRP
ncbi:MAG: c-type cytochrome [Acidobacteria bacterium]|nr:c-type cytochrome [Acidobacteriota bacterium]MBI3487147.1 c-type cytochrome [Acidobacteriota bacterium]